MARRRTILDCDPGQDDAVNLLLAMASAETLDIAGITTVAGNVPRDLAQRNARIICDLAGRRDIPVFAGAAAPLVCDLVTAEHVHGGTGLDGMEIVDPATPLQDADAADFIVETLRAAPDPGVTLVPTGPLTNIAHALDRAPDIVAKIESIALMGGALREGGNYTPSAEFNIYVDPHAAQKVLSCGRPIAMFGLDVTHKVLASSERVRRIAEIGTPVARAVAGMLGYFGRFDSAKYGVDGAPLHDPCTVVWLLAPDLFRLKPCHVAVETDSSLTRGHTAVDFWGVTGKTPNVDWAWDVDATGFYDLLTESLSRL